MIQFPVGVITDSFRTNLMDSIKKARDVGADGIQIYATKGEMDPDQLSAARRREIADFIASHGLVISALCGDLGGHGFMYEDDLRWRIDKSKRIMELARELGTSVVTTHIGVLPEDDSHPRYAIMQKACRELAEFGDQVGAAFAIETGPETAVVLRRFLDSLGAGGVRVNLDPANFVMVTGDDPVQAVHTLAPYIIHTHAKDGIRLQVKSPEIIYGMIEEEIASGEAFREVPLGQGHVDLAAWMKALHDIGYRGFLTIEREVGDQPENDIRQAVIYLREMMKTLNKTNEGSEASS